MQRAYLQLLNRIKGAGFAPKGHVLDNEISDSMKSLIKFTCQLELVPPHCQRRNVAEVSIKAFKQHFLGILASVATDFPKSQWERLLLQADMTLNLLRQENTTPKVSALAYIFGTFNYNRIPLGPMGCVLLVHKKSWVHASWDNHAEYRWCLYTSTDQYHAHFC